jgi:hypothetical protein
MTSMSLSRTAALGLTAWLAIGAAHAQDKGECGVVYTRTACPGKETESFAKCDGQPSCIRYVAAASAQACQAAALKACENDRLDITQSKMVVASYKGTPLKSPTGKDDYCVDYARRAAEYDKCGK